MWSLLFTAFLLLLIRTAVSSPMWSYTNMASNVDKWGTTAHKMCNGVRQSPVALNYKSSTYAPNLPPLEIYEVERFSKSEDFTVMNNGHTLMVWFPACKWYITMNGLRNNEFCVKQFHFHWGGNATSGSEHSLEKRFYPLEMHIVTYNRDLYSNITEAASQVGGLAVIALFFEEKANINVNDTQLFKMSAFLRAARAVRNHSTSAPLPPFDHEDLLTMSRAQRGKFFRYDGSLTTPPCTENVVWTVMRTPLPVTPAQLDVFRSLLFASTEAKSRMMENYRHLQSLNPATVLVPRTIYRSWNAVKTSQATIGLISLLIFSVHCLTV